MAVYDRTQGQVSTASQATPALPSKDISSILVRSLQTALEGTDSGDDSLPDKIADGINKSDLVKVQKGGVSKSGGGSPIDSLLSGGEKDRTKAYEKHLKKEEDAEKKARAERAKRDREIEKAFDTTLRGLSTFAQNPLKGLDNALQAGFKGLFKFGDRLLNKSVGDIGKDMKKMAATVTAPARAVGGALKGIVGGGAAVAKIVSGNALPKATAVKEESKGEKDAKEAKEGKVEKKRDKQAGDQLAAIQSTNLTVGMIFGKIAAFAVGIAAIALLVPIIAGKLTELVLNFKYAAKETPIKFGVFMRKAKAVLFGGLFDLASKLKWPGMLGGGSFLNPALTDEEKAERNTLANTELVKDYEAGKTKIEKLEKEQQAYEALKSKKASGQTLTNEENRQLALYQNTDMEGKAKQLQELKGNVAFWEQNENIKRWNELNEPGGISFTEKYKKEAEEYERQAYHDLYSEDLKNGKITKAQAAWIMSKGGATKSPELMAEMVQHYQEGGPYAAETGMEAFARRGKEVGAQLHNVFGELGHNLAVSTKRNYERHTASTDAELGKAVANYQTNNTNIVVSTSETMGTN